ncbi:MAG: hypothetical protein MSS61_02655 [Bacteroidales bacterium]|nr:hypothetical protein [Bacteroidales bacterium]MDD7232120.1 hypothetical protein [Bacteroidales bacterium]MDY2704984.1 hypothetical protein [Alloprevotella sp.]MDY2915713.1 hypothetical protein [Alloprevotella sp.]
MIKLLTLIAAIYMVYGMGKDLLKAIFTPKKFMRENRDIKCKHIDFID